MKSEFLFNGSLEVGWMKNNLGFFSEFETNGRPLNVVIVLIRSNDANFPTGRSSSSDKAGLVNTRDKSLFGPNGIPVSGFNLSASLTSS